MAWLHEGDPIGPVSGDSSLNQEAGNQLTAIWMALIYPRPLPINAHRHPHCSFVSLPNHQNLSGPLQQVNGSVCTQLPTFSAAPQENPVASLQMLLCRCCTCRYRTVTLRGPTAPTWTRLHDQEPIFKETPPKNVPDNRILRMNSSISASLFMESGMATNPYRFANHSL